MPESFNINQENKLNQVPRVAHHLIINGGICLSVCISVFLTTAYPVDSKFGRCITEDPRKCKVEILCEHLSRKSTEIPSFILNCTCRYHDNHAFLLNWDTTHSLTGNALVTVLSLSQKGYCSENEWKILSEHFVDLFIMNLLQLHKYNLLVLIK